MRKFLFAVVAAAALAVGVASAVAAGGPPTITTVSANFVLTSATCSKLPAGTTIIGTGTGTRIRSTRTDADGLVTITRILHSHGTATDQLGNTYVFNYINVYRVTNTAADPNVFSGLMTDSFALAGNGPSNLNNGFTAIFTTNFAGFSSGQELNSHGDPYDFAAGTARCDPL
jgi:hypothetical protein